MKMKKNHVERILRKITRSNQGFTLVELMVVVAIIGILAAVAIPNFVKYQAKSRQTEAKIGLAAIFTAEKSFSAENNTYTGCLAQAGYTPDGQNHYYSVGYVASSATAAKCGPTGTSACDYFSFSGTTPVGKCNAVDVTYLATGTWTATASDSAFPENMKANQAVTTPPGSASIASVISSTTFTAGATGQVSNLTTNDYWTINDQKVLINSVSGI
jgi:type IV pilus assembly protein PilA